MAAASPIPDTGLGAHQLVAVAYHAAPQMPMSS